MMLLNELLGYHSVEDKSLGDFLRDMSEKGKLKKLGEGAYGAVIGVPGKNYVYKIWVQDWGYEAFLKVAMAHQDNPAFPKIFGKVRKIPLPFVRQKGLEFVKVVKMEKLEDKPHQGWDIMDMIRGWTTFYTKENIEKAVKEQGQLFDDIINNQSEFLKTHQKKLANREISLGDFEDTYKVCIDAIRTFKLKKIRLFSWQPSLFEALHLLAKEYKENEVLSADLHGNNLMFRGSQPVITDPFASDNGKPKGWISVELGRDSSEGEKAPRAKLKDKDKE